MCARVADHDSRHQSSDCGAGGDVTCPMLVLIDSCKSDKRGGREQYGRPQVGRVWPQVSDLLTCGRRRRKRRRYVARWERCVVVVVKSTAEFVQVRIRVAADIRASTAGECLDDHCGESRCTYRLYRTEAELRRAWGIFRPSVDIRGASDDDRPWLAEDADARHRVPECGFVLKRRPL